MRKLLSPIFLVAFFCSSAQETEENPLSCFDPFVGKTWVVNGEWGDGSKFQQELTLEFGLNKKVVIAKTKGFIDQERTQFGDRAHGVRKYNPESKKIEFWEFDTFGGTTTGEIQVNGKDLWYIYEAYDMTFADIWEYLDEETYAFRVVQYENGELGDQYLKSAYKLKK